MPIIASVAAVQVTEALKILTTNMDALHRSLMQIDIWQNDWRKIKLSGPVPECKACGRREFEFLDPDAVEVNAVLCGRDAVQVMPPSPAELDLAALAERLRNIMDVKQNEYLVRFRAEDNEVTVFKDGRAIIKGTDDVAAARGIYAKFVGS
jgi:adenylyltransferase/sulfurtransferase